MADDAESRWRTNIGRCPPELVGTSKRVFVRLRCGLEPRDPDGNLQSWPADTGMRGRNTRWTLEEHPFDIVKWRLANDG